MNEKRIKEIFLKGLEVKYDRSCLDKILFTRLSLEEKSYFLKLLKEHLIHEYKDWSCSYLIIALGKELKPIYDEIKTLVFRKIRGEQIVKADLSSLLLIINLSGIEADRQFFNEMLIHFSNCNYGFKSDIVPYLEDNDLKGSLSFLIEYYIDEIQKEKPLPSKEWITSKVKKYFKKFPDKVLEELNKYKNENHIEVKNLISHYFA